MNLVYWLLIVAAVIFHTIALVLTWYALTYLGSKECNNFMATSFSTFGHLTTGTLSLILIIIGMISIPLIFKENEHIKLKSLIYLSVFTIFLGIDALNDIFVVTNNDLSIITLSILKLPYFLIGNQFTC